MCQKFRLLPMTVVLALVLASVTGCARHIGSPAAAARPGHYLASLASRTSSSPVFTLADTTNRVTIVNDGYQAMLLRVHLFRNARISINVQTFILTNDECGRLFMYELIQAAKRGVKVRMIADHFASDKDCDLAAVVAEAHPNLEFKYYRPAAGRLKPSRFRKIMNLIFRFRDANQRMHNKIITADGIVALTGGRNIENTYYHFSTGMNFKDRDILVTGPVVAEMEASFEEFWAYKHAVAGKALVDVAKRIKAGDYKKYSTWEEFQLGGFFERLTREANDDKLIQSTFAEPALPVEKMEFICDRAGKNRRWHVDGDGVITERLRKELRNAKQELVLQTPYLILDKSGRKFFKKLRKKHPELKVLISSNSFGSTDNVIAYSANYKWRSLYIEDLDLRIFEYMPLPADLLRVFPAYPQMEKMAEAKSKEGDKQSPFLCIHAKSFVMDDRVAYIGTYNLDPRSANLNTEVGLIIYDEKVAAWLKADILKDTEPGNSWVIAQKETPLSLDKVNQLFERLSCAAPVDLWPFRNTSSFELKKGEKACDRGHPDFYKRYRDMSGFPGKEGILSGKETETRMIKLITGLAAPIL